MKHEGPTLILNTWQEIEALESGYREDEHSWSPFESDLSEARNMSVPMDDETVRVFQKSWPEFRFRPENMDDAKGALENTLALRGLKGWRAKRAGKKQQARRILDALALAEGAQGIDS